MSQAVIEEMQGFFQDMPDNIFIDYGVITIFGKLIEGDV